MNDIMPSQRNWFPVILAGLTIVLALGFYAKFHPDEIATWTAERANDSTPIVTAPAVTEDQYRAAVTSIFATYDINGSPREAYNALIALHVPASMQQFHIDCIIALGKLDHADSDAAVEEAMARFAALHAQYSWFTL